MSSRKCSCAWPSAVPTSEPCACKTRILNAIADRVAPASLPARACQGLYRLLWQAMGWHSRPSGYVPSSRHLSQSQLPGRASASYSVAGARRCCGSGAGRERRDASEGHTGQAGTHLIRKRQCAFLAPLRLQFKTYSSASNAMWHTLAMPAQCSCISEGLRHRSQAPIPSPQHVRASMAHPHTQQRATRRRQQWLCVGVQAQERDAAPWGEFTGEAQD